MSEWIRLTQTDEDGTHIEVDVRASAISLFKSAPHGSRIFVIGAPASQFVAETPGEIRRLLGINE
jgi:hypothetical protein